VSAAGLSEGLEETLTLHRLRLRVEMGPSFSSTNMIELIVAQVKRRATTVDRRPTSVQEELVAAAPPGTGVTLPPSNR